MRKAVLISVIILALAGAIDSAYALREHYAPLGSASCDINETVSCTRVNQSQYSDFQGVPVAAIGIAGYLFLAAMATVTLAGALRRNAGMAVLLATATVALLFSARLTYAELFILGTICPLCVISQVLIAAITALAFIAALRR